MKPIVVKNISKSFGSVLAIDKANIEVDTAELFDLIGPDGAGKSTLFKIMTSLLIPDEGEAYVWGYHTVKEYKKIRKIIGYMPGKFSLYPDLSVEENLKFFASIFSTTIEENYDLIKEIYVQIEPFKNRRAGKLSGGMKQKLALCCALIHEPKVLFLDEPTTGVDAVSRSEFWDMLKRLKNKGITIIVRTPYMDEAVLCDRIALIQDGKILQVDTPQNIIDTYSDPLYAVKSNEFYKLLHDMRNYPLIKSVEPFGEYLHVTTTANASMDSMHQYILNSGHKEVDVKLINAGIEDVFLKLMHNE